MIGAPAVMVPKARRIYLDKHCEVFCLVSPQDYEWCIQWRWTFCRDRWGRKIYAVRHTRQRKITSAQITVFMHKAILSERMGLEPPSPEHTIGDHLSGNSLDNQRENLEWATPLMNAATSRRWAS